MKKFIEKLTKRLNKDEKGFTLIELIIVIAILAVIAAIAVPNIMGAINNSRKTADVSNAKIIADAVATVQATYEDYSSIEATIVVDGSRSSNPVRATVGSSRDRNLENYIINSLQNIPEPKYKGRTHFDVDVDENGTITINIPDGSDTYEVYPNVSSEYQND